MIGRTAEVATYRGYRLIIDNDDILIVAPNGDVACFYSMLRARTWINKHRERTGWVKRS